MIDVSTMTDPNVIGFRIPVRSFTDPTKKPYSVFFSRHYPAGLCDCSDFSSRHMPCKHIELACASLKINPDVAVPVYRTFDDPFNF